MALAVPCLICGRRVVGGKSRCPEHENQKNRLQTACAVCGRASSSDYCDEHEPTNEANRLKAQPFRAAYRDPLYHRNRQAAKNRAGGKCERCGRADMPLECDHIVALRDGGTNDRTNLIMLCRPCHLSKTTADRRRRNP